MSSPNQAKHSTESIVLTGCGWVTPFGIGTCSDLLAMTVDPPGDILYWPVPQDWISSSEVLSKELKHDKASAIAGLALEQAVRHASLDLDSMPRERIGLVVGSGFAGMIGMMRFADDVRTQSARFVSPINFPQTVGNYVGGALARAFQLRGPNLMLATDLCSGLDAIAQACDFIREDSADMVLAGGVEEMNPALVDGRTWGETMPSEGACFFCIETAGRAAARKVSPLAYIETAWQNSSHKTGSRSSPQPAQRCDTLTQENRLVSSIGVVIPGAIHIEQMIGRCIGSLGASAVAAVIAACNGVAVPVVDQAGSKITTRKTVTIPSSNEFTSCSVVAVGNAHQTRVDLKVNT